MKLKRFMMAALLLIGFAGFANAQESQSWTGTDYNEAVGQTVFLYNVGTGRFLVHGGDWGTQARLFSKDWGKSLTPTLNDGRYIIKTGVNTGDAAVLGSNVPLITSGHAWKGNNDEETFNLLMDANENYSGNGVSGQRAWHFVPVDEGDGTYTYYMYETLGSSTTTSFYYITFTDGSTTYYLKVTNNSTVSVTTNVSEAQKWTTVSTSYISYTSGSTNYYLKYNSGTPVVATGTNGNTAKIYLTASPPYVVYESDRNTYYLKYNTGNLSFATGTSGNRFSRSAQQSETTGGTNYWLGAAYGENGPADAAPGEGHEGDPVGKLCLLASGFDKAVWSTADPRTTTEYPCQLKGAETAYLTYDDEDAKTVNRSMATEVRVFNEHTYVPLNDLYKWRIVTQDQFFETLSDGDKGDALATNLTWMITDRGFERSDNSFFNTDYGWKTGRVTGVTYPPSTSMRRYGYTWGLESQGTNQQTSPHKTEPWNAPVRLKTEWVDKNNAKYGFMEFEGAGTASTYLEAPATGVYRIACYGFYQGSNPGYIFATKTNPQGTTPVDPANFVTKNLKQETAAPYRNADKDEEGSVTRTSNPISYSGSGVMFAGATFLNDFPTKDDYYCEIEITLMQDDIVYFGVGKNGATQSSADVSGYYHDTEYVGVDQFEISYLGTDPVLFNEDETSLDYLKDNGADKQYTNQSIRLHRTMVKDQWNSFVFPLDLDATQVRNAFGDACAIAEITDMGKYSKLPTCIDFTTKSLANGNEGIKAGKFYLVKPVIEPKVTTDGITYYDCGRKNFNTSEFSNIAKETVYVSQEAKDYANEHEMNQSWLNNVVTTYGTFVNEQQIPAGSYVMGYKKTDDGQNVQLYRITKATTIKGFRGWIEDGKGTTSAGTLSVGGIFDTRTYVDPTTGVEHVQMQTRPADDDLIYDMSGRRIGKVGQVGTLPRGLYIVNGKKVFVK